MTAQAALAARGALACAPLGQQIFIAPGNVARYGPASHGPPVLVPAVTVPGTADGVYDS